MEFEDEVAKLWGIIPWDTWKELREEEIEAVDRKWNCIVYEDTTTVKGATRTMWMSKDYPGLFVKITTKGKYNDSEEILVEWED